jgi:hypothetical protein
MEQNETNLVIKINFPPEVFELPYEDFIEEIQNELESAIDKLMDLAIEEFNKRRNDETPVS